MQQQAYTFSSAQHAGVALPSLLFVPKAYGVNPRQRSQCHISCRVGKR